jgi:26S proteasome regulatory subunit N3
VHKLLILVQLLMGEIPDRAIFAQADLRVPLAPYFNLTMVSHAPTLTATLHTP